MKKLVTIVPAIVVAGVLSVGGFVAWEQQTDKSDPVSPDFVVEENVSEFFPTEAPTASPSPVRVAPSTAISGDIELSPTPSPSELPAGQERADNGSSGPPAKPAPSNQKTRTPPVLKKEKKSSKNSENVSPVKKKPSVKKENRKVEKKPDSVVRKKVQDEAGENKKRAPSPKGRRAVLRSIANKHGCSSSKIVYNNQRILRGHAATADWYNNTIHINSSKPLGFLKYAVAHECAHIKQYVKYGGNIDRLKRDMNRVYGGSGFTGLERNADCVAQHWGYRTSVYTGSCGGNRGKVARDIARVKVRY